MPIDYKKLYENHDIILTNANPDSLVKDGTLESVGYLKNYFTQRERFKPPVDFSDLKNFARYGSAEKYYVDSFDRIYETYPYDGSLKERISWELSSSFFDMYVFDEVYPRTNGYVLLSAAGWGTQVDWANMYGATATASYEYIFVKGGPHTSKRSKDKDINDASGDYKSGYANVWDPSKNRECNLKIGGIDGNTVEFWMKKAAYATSKTGREVIFDASTSDFISSSVNYGRLTVEMTGTTVSSPFLVTYMSGTAGFSEQVVGSSVTTATVADDKWHHYAFALKNTGSQVQVDFYVDGKCEHTVRAGTSVGYVSGNINATIGSLYTAPSGTYAPTKGWGKLSGSLDEFRFWKDKRNPAEVVRYMIEPVGGGTNTDDANTSLGVYYKFNEGITQTASIDRNILDFSGRISNGTFVGYNSEARNVGSAMVNSGFVSREFKDPILYPFHPTVQSTLRTKKEEGQIHDFANNASIYHSLPAWIVEEDEDKEYSPLKNLTQVVGSYFDSLAEQINTLPALKYKSHMGFEHKPAPFNDRLLQSIGFQYFPELFSDATELEYYKSRDDRALFEQKIYDVKNKIYHNIYNNIIYINKTKGTQKSFRNLLHCFGVGDEIYRINTYGNRVTYQLKDNYQSTPEYKKYVNFGLTGSSEATVFPHSSSGNPNSKAFMSGTEGLTDYLGFTMESEVHFPIRNSLADSNTVVTTDSGPSRQFRTYIPYTTASLFGMHQVRDTPSNGNDLTWGATDTANFQVFAIKASDYSQRAKFLLTGTVGSAIGALGLSSNYFDNVFDDTRWTFSVSVKPTANANLPDGSSGSINNTGYLVEFYGVEKIADYIKSEFYQTGTISADSGSRLLNKPKAPYIGAHRTNFSGTLLQKADGNISSARVWFMHLPTGTIRQHNQDVKNYGTEHPYRSTYLYPTALTGTRIPEIDTLALNWTFDTVTGSDASGEFIGADYSSGSAQKVSKYGEFGQIVGKQYLPKGFNFPANSSLPINKKYVSSAKKQLPEMINSADMINILTDDDENFNMGDLARPTNYYTSIEKSMYQTISDEMIKMFSTIKDFNNLVGEPVNKYRDDYKNMAKLRQMFYERVSNTPDLDKYVAFYKWIDLTLDSLLGYLVPMSSDMTDQYGSNVRTMVENTVLQRNKYRWKYPTLEDKTPILEGNLLGINELLYDWEYGHAPLNTINMMTFVKASSQYFSVPDAAAFSFGNGVTDSAFSANFWLKASDMTALNLFSKYGAVNNQEYYLFTDGSDRFDLYLEDESTGGIAHGRSTALTSYQGELINVTVTYDGGGGATAANGISMYVNGVALTIAAFNDVTYTAMEAGSHAFEIGRGLDINYTDSTIGNFSLFNKELSAADALLLYKNGCAGDVSSILPVDLVAYYKLSDLSGADSSGNGYTGSPQNSPTITSFLCNGAGEHNCLWWKERSTRLLGSDDTFVNTDKQTILDSITNETNAPAPTLGSTSSAGIATYAGSTYATRRLAKPLRLKVDESPVIKGGVNEFVNKQTDLLTFIKHSTSGSYMVVPDSSVLPFKSCKDDVALHSGKRKQSFNSSVNSFKLTGVENSYLTSKGDLYAFFDIYSASLAGGYHDNVAANFKPGIDITNLHEDTYGPMYGRPVQGPFTEKFVGGKVYRHINSNLRPQNTSPDTVENRIEGWRIMFSSNSLYAFGSGYGNNMLPNPHLPKGSMFRGDQAKRPVNIKNIKMFAGSTSSVPGRPGQVLGATNIGNYSHNYDLVMTSGRSINNRYLAEAGALPSTYAPSTYVTGVIDFAMPRRDLTGSTKSIIVNRFSAPGSPATMGQGMLDIAAAEYSVYNALPWRNLIARMYLNEWYTDHTNQFGYFSDYQTWAAYRRAGETYIGGSSSVIAPTYGGTGSFHKVHRNSRKKPIFLNAHTTSSYGVETVHDNWFVQHQIPQTDLQYAWITASVANGYSGAALYGFEQPNYSNASLASTDITFCSASDFGSVRLFSPIGPTLLGRWFGASKGAVASSALLEDIVPIDFAGMNLNIYEPITASQNSIGYPQLAYVANFGDSFGGVNYITPYMRHASGLAYNVNGEGMSSILNSLILNRQGPYGWPSWKQTRGAQHPVMRYNYKNNIQTFTTASGEAVSGDKVGYSKTIVSQIEPPITSKFNPLEYKYTYKSDQPFADPNTSIKMWSSYGNEKVYFTNVPDPKISKLLDLNNSSLIWSKAGQIGETLQSADNKILAYDTLKKYLLWNTPTYIDGDANPIDEFQHMRISEGIYPREHYTYLSIVRERANYINDYWKDGRSNRTLELTNSQGYTIAPNTAFWQTASIWSLDADEIVRASQPGEELWSSGSEGELQNSYSIWHTSGPVGSTYSLAPIPAATYNRRVPILDPSAKTFFWGQTEWEAGEQAGYNPSYDTYKEYVEDVKRVGKDYGIIPEYRISEHMKYHVVDKASDGGFLAPNRDWLSLTGAAISGSDDNTSGEGAFYTTYTNSDFLKYFQPIESDFSKVAAPTNLTLRCNTIMKFLPYDGFYPSERSVQLATLFSQSFFPTANLIGTEANWRTLLAPFFSPGILYNSIKSGLAVDYPVYKGPTTDYFDPDTTKLYMAVNTARATDRVPFEALVNPDYWLSDLQKIVDSDCHHSASIDSTGSFGEPVNDLYRRAINNFVAEVPRFFLGGTAGNNNSPYGPMTTFASKETMEGTGFGTDPNDSGEYIPMTKDKTYKMRIVCSHSKIRNLSTLLDATTEAGAQRAANKASYIYNEPTIMMYNRAFERVTQTKYLGLTSSHGLIPWFAQVHNVATNYPTSYVPIYGSSFGPPMYAGGFTGYVNGAGFGGVPTSSFEAYTPPYYNGYSHIELSYTAQYDGNHTITDIISGITATYHREMITAQASTAAGFSPNAGLNAAAASAMHLTSSLNWKKVVSSGASKSRWIIQPKWECPVLDFTTPDATLRNAGDNRDYATAKGMWHQYGTIPSDTGGLFLEIQPVDATDDTDTIGNLAELLGFDEQPARKLGQIPSGGKTVREAIVAVPFYENTANDRKYFHIDKKTIHWAKSKLLNPEIKDIDYVDLHLAGVENVVKYKPAPSVINMVDSMGRYVIPPLFDFLKNENQEPMAMMIFEFEHHFTQDDLVKMWQGVLPSEPRTNAASGIQVAAAEIDIGINLREAAILEPTDAAFNESVEDMLEQSKGFDLLNEIPGEKSGPSGVGFPKNIQWMVFKVKQRSAMLYDEIIGADMPVPPPAGAGPGPVPTPPVATDQPQYKYNYNWPYDFFSLIELAKITETVTMEPRGPIPDNTSTIIDMLNILPPDEALWNIPPILDSVSETDKHVFIKKVFPTWTRPTMKQFVQIQLMDQTSQTIEVVGPESQDSPVSKTVPNNTP